MRADLAVRGATRQWLTKVTAATKATKAEAERAAEAIHVYGQMFSVAAIQNSRWCLVVMQFRELLGI